MVALREQKNYSAMRVFSILAFVVLASPALAQTVRAPVKDTKVWTPAPTAGYNRDDGAPADRAGVTTGPQSGVLFSSTPTGAVTDSGGNSPQTALEAQRFGNGTPNLGK